jgi:hypothetical protein
MNVPARFVGIAQLGAEQTRRLSASVEPESLARMPAWGAFCAVAEILTLHDAPAPEMVQPVAFVMLPDGLFATP